VHRADAHAVVGRGSNYVSVPPWPLLPDWYPLEVLHVPVRSREQCARKYEKTWSGWQENLRGDLATARTVSERAHGEEYFDRLVIDDDRLRRGLAVGSLVEDARLRDAFRALRAADPLQFDRPSPREEAGHAVEAACLAEAEVVRLGRRLDELHVRIASLGGGL
jgi:hypothetical protein